MLDVDFFKRYPIVPSPLWEGAVALAFGAMERATRTRVLFEDFVRPASPVMFATNSTQKYDFLIFRAETRRQGLPVVTVTKGKNYHSPLRLVLEHTGVVPLASRGYILLVDFTAVHARRPTEDEYRALRDHLNDASPLPDAPVFRAISERPREVLGHRFDPRERSWRDFIRQVYRFVLGEALRLSREAVAAGYHIQMYPEGTVSSRLGRGRIGAVQFAHALGIPIVPVGMCGCREVFKGQGMTLRGGDVTMRFGAPWVPTLGALPKDFVHFDPEHEARHRATLQAATDTLMTKIDALLDARHRHDPDHAPDGTQGTRRFL